MLFVHPPTRDFGTRNDHDEEFRIAMKKVQAIVFSLWVN